MESIRFMRLILFFDLPVDTPAGKREYRRFIKYLASDGFVRMQYSVYCRLCINADAAKTISKRVVKEAPVDGDIRFMTVTETQYQNINNINETYSLQESLTTSDRTIMIGGMNNDEDKK